MSYSNRKYKGGAGCATFASLEYLPYINRIFPRFSFDMVRVKDMNNVELFSVFAAELPQIRKTALSLLFFTISHWWKNIGYLLFFVVVKTRQFTVYQMLLYRLTFKLQTLKISGFRDFSALIKLEQTNFLTHVISKEKLGTLIMKAAALTHRRVSKRPHPPPYWQQTNYWLDYRVAAFLDYYLYLV